MAAAEQQFMAAGAEQQFGPKPKPGSANAESRSGQGAEFPAGQKRRQRSPFDRRRVETVRWWVQTFRWRWWKETLTLLLYRPFISNLPGIS